jgi:alpha-L-fucosidase
LGAAPVALTNHSFELPATGKILGWDSAGSDIPGWKSLVTATNSGVESAWMGHTDGVWTAFAGHGDVGALNLSSHTIAANEEFTFTLDARDNWTDSTGASLRIGLYYDAAGQMVPVASTDVHPLTNWQSYSVTFPAHSVPAAIGKRIGVWFQNIYYPGLSWIGADNARLDVAPSPFCLWQVAYFGGGNTNAAPDADPDGDGLCNQSEFLAGTNPTNAASNLKLTSAAMETNGLRLAWKTAGTRTNVVQVSADLLDTSFVDASGPIVLPGTGDTATNFLDPAARTNAGSRFYRVRQEPLPPGSLTERVARWQNWRFGMFIHWGPVSLAGSEISWSRNGPRGTDGCSPITGGLPTATYDSLYHQFNPTNFNADQWVKIARETGMKYLVLTAKHHDGFCLWPTKVHDYHIGNSPFQRDVCGELASAIHRAGLGLGWYYSAPDWKDPDCRTTNNAAYVTRMQGHLRELLTDYGKVDVLWIDADGCSAPWDRATTYPLIKSLQPAMLINNRLDMGNMDDVHAQRIVPPAHFYTPEQKVGNYDDQRPWESCITIGTQWAWKPNDTLKPVKEIVQTVANCAGGDGNLLLNVGPMPTGEIEPRQVEVLRGVGNWMASYGESIYGTRGGPFKPGYYGVSTRKGNTIYVHIFNWLYDSVTLPTLAATVVSSRVLTGGTASVTQTNGILRIAVPAGSRNPTNTVVALELDRPASGLPAVDVSAPVSLTTGKAATASNYYQNDADYGPAKAVDGNSQTRWATDVGTASAWLEVDLGATKTFDCAVLMEAYPGRVRSFQLQWRNGSNWQTFATGTTIGEAWSRTFIPVTARRVRLSITAATEGPSIWEFQLF